MKGNRSGQVIILTVLILGATLLGAASLSSLLMLYQIRQATDMGNSGKAIFAADTGVEWVLYNRFNPGVSTFFKNNAGRQSWEANLSNDTKVEVRCYKDNTPINDCSDEEVNNVRSVGIFNNTSRAFKLSF